MITGPRTRLPPRVSLTQYRDSLLQDLARMAEVMLALPVLGSVFDRSWHDRIREEIASAAQADLVDGFKSNRCPLFFLLRDDPDALRLIDTRLAALQAQANRQVVDAKLHELRSSRFALKQLEHLFELNVLGAFAEAGHLQNLDVPVAVGTVDGEIVPRERSILVEVTLTSQRLLATGPGVFCIALQALTDQVQKKVVKKVAGGRQLAHAGKHPTILVLGLHPFGADQQAAKWGIAEMWEDPRSAMLSAIVVSDSWRFLHTRLHINPRATNPLQGPEIADLRGFLALVRSGQV